MGNFIQKLGQVLENRTTNIIILAVFSFSNVAIIGLNIGLLNTKEVVSLLYTLNMVMIFHAIDESIRQSQRKGNIPVRAKSRRILRPAREHSDVIENESPNMFIDRWKKLNLYRTPEFPLERLAYLNSTIYNCVGKHFFFIRNSQVKQLSIRKVPLKHCDEECHPKKLVTDLFGSYVHRRSLFYKNRNVSAASQSQFTKSMHHPSRSEEFDVLTYSVLYSKEEKKKMEKVIEPDDESSDSSSEEKGPKKYLKSVKKAMGSAFDSLIPKSMSKSKEGEQFDKTCFVEK